MAVSGVRQALLAGVGTRSVLQRRTHAKRMYVFQLMSFTIIHQFLIFTSDVCNH
jgi:hypothetical protein